MNNPSPVAARVTFLPANGEGVCTDAGAVAVIPEILTALLDELDDVEERQVEADDHAADHHTHHDDEHRLDQ